MALLSISSSVFAQLSGTLSAVSDYRYRGISLSYNQPAVQLSIVYDDAQGWYAGTFASTVKSATYGTRGAQSISFAGFAWRMPSGLSLEAGADFSVQTTTPHDGYGEVYGGFAFRNLSGRMYYSPRYFGQNSPAIYGELNVAQPVLENVRVLAHVGALGSDLNKRYGNPPGPLVDAAAGVGIDWQGFGLQVSWVGVNRASAAYATNGAERRGGVIVSLSRSF